MEKMVIIIISLVLILLGILQLYLRYRYSQNIKKLKIRPTTAPFAIWSGVVFGIFFIVFPILVMIGNVKAISNAGHVMSIISGILFWIAAIFALVRANKMRKQLKTQNKPLISSWQVIATYAIVIAAAIMGLCAIL
ncbi:hypothetical protein GDZ32_08115 [Lactobacillus helveticus]|uniref:Uncharacterized protein n=2 Tax=Lactobacillus helveticus TaxID=1587 RepID=A0A6A7K2K4_LACHE|nr:hypothetical protein [Lactobacillus helveticus]MPW14831.1 hypothetical protein [Lactobacillus helveticus]